MLHKCVVSVRAIFNFSSFPSLHSRRFCWPHLAFCGLGKPSPPPETPQTTPPGMAALVRPQCWDGRGRNQYLLHFFEASKVLVTCWSQVSCTPLDFHSSQDPQQWTQTYGLNFYPPISLRLKAIKSHVYSQWMWSVPDHWNRSLCIQSPAWAVHTLSLSVFRPPWLVLALHCYFTGPSLTLGLWQAYLRLPICKWSLIITSAVQLSLWYILSQIWPATALRVIQTANMGFLSLADHRNQEPAGFEAAEGCVFVLRVNCLPFVGLPFWKRSPPQGCSCVAYF